MRFLLRSVSFLLLVAAVFAATLDSITSVAESAVTLTSIGSAWTAIDPASLAEARARLGTADFPGTLGVWFSWLLLQPAFALALALSLLFWMAGYRRPPAAGRFAA